MKSKQKGLRGMGTQGKKSRRSRVDVQPFSQNSRTPTVAKEFQIGLCGVAEADLDLFRNCWSVRILGERL